MAIYIFNKRTYFYQYDIDQKFIVEDDMGYGMLHTTGKNMGMLLPCFHPGRLHGHHLPGWWADRMAGHCASCHGLVLHYLVIQS